MLPGYDVGGDFFDYAGNADGLWLVIADATARATRPRRFRRLRSARCAQPAAAGAGLQEAARLAEDAIVALDIQRYLTAVVGSWDANGGCCDGSTVAIPRR